MDLHNLPKLKGKERRSKRVGRGIGSGKGGHTSGKGQKGQKSRTGYNLPVGFEGGQVPLYKKMPVRKGFVNSHKLQILALNLSALELLEDGSIVRPEHLIEKKIIAFIPRNGIKILADGELKKKITFEGFLYSKAAKEKIEKAGGKAI